MSRFIDLVEALAASPTDGTMEALVEMAVQGNVDEDEIAHLTCCLAESEIRLDIPELGTVTDIASTGGLASLKKGGSK